MGRARTLTNQCINMALWKRQDKIQDRSKSDFGILWNSREKIYTIRSIAAFAKNTQKQISTIHCFIVLLF